MLTREQLVDNILDLYINNSDNDGCWNATDIVEEVHKLVVQQGQEMDRIIKCGHCETWYPTSTWDCCPYYDDHECDGGCGNINSECSCDDCPDCGLYYESCECPRCTKCGEKRADCNCPEEDAVFA